MRKNRFAESQIIGILKEVESGGTGQGVCREHGISKHTLYRWKMKYGGMEASDARRLRELEETNSPSDSLHEWTDFGADHLMPYKLRTAAQPLGSNFGGLSSSRPYLQTIESIWWA